MRKYYKSLDNMLTIEQINQIRAKSGLPPKPVGQQNYVGKYDHLKPKQSFAQETADDIKQVGSSLKATYQETKEKIGKIADAEMAGEQGKLRSFGQAFGAVAGGISRGIGDVFVGGVKAALPQSGEDKIKAGLANTIEKLSAVDNALGRPVGSTIEAYNSLPDKSKRDIDSLLGISQLAMDLTGIGVGKKAGEKVVQTGVKAGEAAVDASKTAVKSAVETGKELSVKAKGVLTPNPKPIEALKEVLQGKTSDLKQGLKSLSALDTSGVKTYQDLKNVISSKIENLAEIVDTILINDKSKTKLDDLLLVKSTVSGTKVAINPVKKAISHLGELYQKIGDEVKFKELQEAFKKAAKDGLTKYDINELARLYGQEFGSKAFSKIGEALTSVNAKLYENTRTQLKELARKGMDKTAEQSDKMMSSLYNTQRLIDKNIEAVNKLQQKIRQRGLLEEVGYNLSKYSDVLSGGTLRGIVGGLLPRGVGYKVLNAIDIEKSLQKNLEIIQKAIKSKSDDELNRLLKSLDSIKKTAK